MASDVSVNKLANSTLSSNNPINVNNFSFSFSNQNGLSIASFNVCRLVLRFNIVISEILSKNYDIVAITETFLDPLVNDSTIMIPGYDVFRSDRLNKQGGCVVLYVKNNIPIRILSSSCSNEYSPSEILIAELKINNENLIFSVIFRPPWAPHPSDFFYNLTERLTD